LAPSLPPGPKVINSEKDDSASTTTQAIQLSGFQDAIKTLAEPQVAR